MYVLNLLWRLALLSVVAILLFGSVVPGESKLQRFDEKVAAEIRWFALLDSAGFEFPRIITAQMILETGDFSSEIYHDNNNYFGMKYRKTNDFTSGAQHGHANYANVYQSLKDYRRYQRMILRLARKQGYIIKSEEDYLWLLEHLPHCKNCRYAEDLQYTNKLRSLLKELPSWPA